MVYMFNKVLSLIILSTFLFSTFAKAGVPYVFSDANNKQISVVDSASLKVTISENHCDDCRDDGCDDEGSCCLRFCSCTTNFFMSSNKTLASISPLISSKIEWYFYNNYISPFLDPALKPPLFS